MKPAVHVIENVHIRDNPLHDGKVDSARVAFGGKPAGTKQIHATGDLHGNAVKFLNFLMLKGVLKFKEPQKPSADELRWCGINPPGPKDYFEFFKAMYDRPLSEWKNGELEKLLNSLADKIDISEFNKIINIGDDFYDRGKSDVFTMLLFGKLAEKGAIVPLLSNHGLALVEVMEKRHSGKLTPEDFNGNLVSISGDDSPSGRSLGQLVQQGAISVDYIEKFYDDHFKTNIQLFHFVESDDGLGDKKLDIFNHAPINDVDILRASLICLQQNGKNGYKLTSEDIVNIQLAISHAKGEGGKKLNNDDLKNLISIINTGVKFHAKEGLLFPFLKTDLMNDHGLYFGDKYTGGNGKPTDFSSQPLLHILWNRNDPALNKSTTLKNKDDGKIKIQSECDFMDHHGHVSEDDYFLGCNNLDAMTGYTHPGGGSANVQWNGEIRAVSLVPKSDVGLTMVVKDLYKDKGITQQNLCDYLGEALKKSNVPEFSQEKRNNFAIKLLNTKPTAVRDKVTAALIRALEHQGARKTLKTQAAHENYLLSLDKLSKELESMPASKETLAVSNYVDTIRLKLREDFAEIKRIELKQKEDKKVVNVCGQLMGKPHGQNISTLANDSAPNNAPLRKAILNAGEAYDTFKTQPTNPALYTKYQEAIEKLIIEITNNVSIDPSTKVIAIESINKKRLELKPLAPSMSKILKTKTSPGYDGMLKTIAGVKDNNLDANFRQIAGQAAADPLFANDIAAAYEAITSYDAARSSKNPPTALDILGVMHSVKDLRDTIAKKVSPTNNSNILPLLDQKWNELGDEYKSALANEKSHEDKKIFDKNVKDLNGLGFNGAVTIGTQSNQLSQIIAHHAKTDPQLQKLIDKVSKTHLVMVNSPDTSNIQNYGKALDELNTYIKNRTSLANEVKNAFEGVINVIHAENGKNVALQDYLPGGAAYSDYTQAYAESKGSFYQAFGGNTSDHAYRVVQVNPSKGTALRGGTWNMLNQGKELKNKADFTGKYNSPVKIQESDGDYEARKLAQILTLIEILRNGNGTEPLDFLCLQEADWAFAEDSNPLKNEFQKVLDLMGYAMVTTADQKGAPKRQRMVTLYNTKTLEPDLSKTEYLFPSEAIPPQCRGFKTVFTRVRTGEKIAVVNAHLEYDENYKENEKTSAKTMQQTLEKNPEMTTIMMGDFNHKPGENMPYAVGYKKASSVISGVRNYTAGKREDTYAENTSGQIEMTLDHENTGEPASYDYAVVRPKNGTTVTVQPIAGQEITLDKSANAARFNRVERKAKPRHISWKTGEPIYENEKYALKQKEAELRVLLANTKTSSNDTLINGKVTEMDALIQARATREGGLRPNFIAKFVTNQLPEYKKLTKLALITTLPTAPGAPGPGAGAGATVKKPPKVRAAHAINTAPDLHRDLRGNIGALVRVLQTPTLATQALIDINNAKENDTIRIGKNILKVNKEMKTALTSSSGSDTDKIQTLITSQVQAYKTSKTSKDKSKKHSRILRAYEDLAKPHTLPHTLTKAEEEMLHRHEVKQLTSGNLPPDIQDQLKGKEHVVAVIPADENSNDLEILTASGKTETLCDLAKIYDNGMTPVFEDNEELCAELNAAAVKMNLNGTDYFIKGRVMQNPSDPTKTVVVYVKSKTDTNDSTIIAKLPYVSKKDVDAYKSANPTQSSLSVGAMMELGKQLEKKPENKDVNFISSEKAEALKAKFK